MKLTDRAGSFSVALAAGAATFCVSVAAKAGDIPWKIDEPTAQRLASEAHYGNDTGSRFFDYDRNLDRPFFTFYGLTKPPVEGSFGYFAVNPWTGDVWALWGCHKLSTPILRKSQAEIRRRFTPAEMKQYARLSALKPECIVED